MTYGVIGLGMISITLVCKGDKAMKLFEYKIVIECSDDITDRMADRLVDKVDNTNIEAKLDILANDLKSLPGINARIDKS